MSSLEQQAFDKALKHIRKQGEPSTNPNGCCYLSPRGLKCGFSPFLKNDEARSKADVQGGGGFSAGSAELLLSSPELVASKWRKLDTDVAADLQMAHDSASSDDNFMVSYETRMKAVAATYNLTYTPPGEDK